MNSQNIKEAEDLIQKIVQSKEIQPSMIADSRFVNNESSNQLSTLEQQYQAEIYPTDKDDSLMQLQIQNFNSAQDINMRQEFNLNEKTIKNGQQQRPIISDSEMNPYSQSTKTENQIQRLPRINEEIQLSIVTDSVLVYNKRSSELKIVEEQNKEEISPTEKDNNLSQTQIQYDHSLQDMSVRQKYDLNEQTFRKGQQQQLIIQDSEINSQTKNTKIKDFMQQPPENKEEIQHSTISNSRFVNNQKSKELKIVQEQNQEKIGPSEKDKHFLKEVTFKKHQQQQLIISTGKDNNVAQSLIHISAFDATLRSAPSLNDGTIKKGSKEIPVISPKPQSKEINSQIMDKSVISRENLSEISKYFSTTSKQKELIANQQKEQNNISNNKTISLNNDSANNNDMITKSSNLNESKKQNEINIKDTTVQIHQKEEIIKLSDKKLLQKDNDTSFANNITNCLINDEVYYDQAEICDIDANQSYSFNKKSNKIEQEVEVQLNNNNFLLSIQDYPENLKKIFNFIWLELEKKGYYLQNYLAKGGEGILFVGYDQKSIERVFKILLDSDQNMLEEEISIMKRFEDGFNIVKYIDFIKISDDLAVIVLEKCQYSLKEELELFRDGKKTFKLENVFKIILDLFDGLIQLRLFKILHLDIKPDNILMKEEGNYVYTDFGLSLLYSNNISSDQVKGYSQIYAPNEQIGKDKNNNVQYKSDIYSLGKTIELIVEIFKGVNSPFEIIKEFEKQILKKMLEQDVENRVDCVKCHDQLIEILIKYNLQNILNQYSQKIYNIVEQFPYDQNKDIPYSLETIIYYYLVELKIIQLEIQKTKKYQQQQTFQDKQQIQNYNTELISQIKKERISNIHLQLGQFYRTIGDSDNSLHFSQESLKITNYFYKGNHLSIATSLNSIGLCYRDIGDYENALRYSLDSLKMRKELFKGNHHSIATSLNNVGLCYKYIGDSENALRYSLDSLKMRKELFKGNHPDIAISLNNVGSCYQDIDDFENALRYQLDSLKMTKELFKGNHPDIATSLNNVGSCYKVIGDSENALRYQLDSLKMTKELFKGNHPDIAISLDNVGSCYKDIGDSENALRYQLDSLKMTKEVFKGNHPDIATSLNNVGLCYQDIGDSQNALRYELYSLKMMQELFKGNHPDIATTLYNVGLCYRDIGDSENALRYQLDSLKMKKELFKGNHSYIVDSL